MHAARPHRAPTLLLVMLMLGGLLLPSARSALANPAPAALSLSAAAAPAPSVDGRVDIGEWPGASQLAFDHGFVRAVSDGVRLYLLVDVLQDTTNNAGGAPQDYFWLTFDTNRDGLITPNVDVNYGLEAGTSNMRLQYYTGPGSWTGVQPTTRSSLGRSFGCFLGDNTLQFISFFPFNITCSRHHVYELGIDLREIGAAAGGQARMGLRVSSVAPNFTDNVPANFTTSFADLIQVSLAPAAAIVSSGAGLSIPANPVEVTQAVQTPSNSLPLVADKATVARANVRSTGPGNEPALVYLYGRRGGTDMPGSPLVKLVTAKTAPNRGSFNDSANFALPASWLGVGGLTLQSAVARATGPQTFSGNVNVTMQTRRTPLYWIVPINEGTNASPNVASEATISAQERYLRTVYPVPNVRIVRKPWQAIGATGGAVSTDQAKALLKTYYNNTVLAWLFTVIFTGKAPFELPEMIYGFKSTGGGSSDPMWYNSGAGRIAVGFIGSSQEGTLAHEFNHNLDRTTSGTWGRHVNPNGTGCGATGPDPNWPHANPNINEIGFDTRGPLAAASVIASNVPDLMSYCQSGGAPTKWTSAYRWQRQFNAFAPASLSAAEAVLSQATAPPSFFYVKGRVNDDGTGELDPVVTQYGQFASDPVSGTFSLDLLDANQRPIGKPFTFDAQFIDPEGDKLPTVSFNFLLPAVQGLQKLVLRQGDQVLDTIERSAAPSVAITAPAAGAALSGLATVRWSASDPDSDALRFTLLYSPDNGATWFPLASDVQGTSYEIDTSTLPGGAGGKLRIIATDGLNTAQADSAGAFSVAGGGPTATIIEPGATTFDEGEAIGFSGDASTPANQDLPEEAFVWSYAPTNLPSTSATTFGLGRTAEATLPAGSYTVTLTVTDGEGKQGTATRTLVVKAPASQVFLPLVVK